MWCITLNSDCSDSLEFKSSSAVVFLCSNKPASLHDFEFQEI